MAQVVKHLPSKHHKALISTLPLLKQKQKQMHIKSTKRCYYTSIRKAKMKKDKNSKCWQGFETVGTLSYTADLIQLLQRTL
jgi:hypothetical protein